MRQAPRTFGREAAPRDYVAGLGRGAIGFTTRGDVGPAFAGAPRGAMPARTQFGQAPRGYVAGAGRGSGGFGEIKPGEGDAAKPQPPTSVYDEDDRDADRIWDAVEARMAERRKKRKRPEEEKAAAPRVADQFADLKVQLKDVTFEQWDHLPESSSGVREHRRQEALVPVSDAIILSRASAAGSEAGLNIERGRMMRDRLDEGGRNGGGGGVDVSGYLTSLDGLGGGSAAASQVGDMHKARRLLKSVTTSNRTHAPGWIAAARLEEAAGKLLEARRIIKEGCGACPKSEDVWLEAARLNTPANAKVLLERATKQLPTSVRLWLAAAELEASDAERRKRVLRRALERVPNSERLWKALVELEEDDAEAHVLLARAVECVPTAVDLWLALAKLEDYKQAQAVINTARRRNPTEPRIWVAACALEEANRQPDERASGPRSLAEADDKLVGLLGKVMGRAVATLSQPDNMVVDRETWLALADEMGRCGSPLTCRAIVRATLDLGLEEADWRRTWMDDAQARLETGNVETARALYMCAVERFPGERAVLLRAITFESKHGTGESLARLLEHAVSKCPEAELFWLMAAKETWKSAGDVPGARSFLERAAAAGHSSERFWLAAVKLEWESGETDRARALLAAAREKNPSGAVYVKSALFERVQGELQAAQALLEEGRARFPTQPKLWLMSAQLLRARGAPVAEERAVLLEGLRHCADSAALWATSAALEEAHASGVKARSVLELARQKCPDAAELWLAAVRLEERLGQSNMARTLLAQALKRLPRSGRLWAHHVDVAPKAEQRARCADALEHCDRDTHVFAALGRLFWRGRKSKAARKWLEDAVAADADNGDAWLDLLALERAQGGAEAAEGVLARIEAAQPRHGERWQRVSKLDRNRGATARAVALEAVEEGHAPHALKEL